MEVIEVGEKTGVVIFGAELFLKASKKLLSEKLRLPNVSLTEYVILYVPVSEGIVKDVLKMFPALFTRNVVWMVPLGKVMLMEAFATSTASVTLAPISMVERIEMTEPFAGVKLMTSGGLGSVALKAKDSV